MMQNLRNGKPIVFRHNCPKSRIGMPMTEEEYKEFLLEMTKQCFSFAEISLMRLPNRSSGGYLGKLFKRKTIYYSHFFEPVHKSNTFCNFALAMNTQTTRRKLTPFVSTQGK